MVKVAIIQADAFARLQNMPEVFTGQWKEVTRKDGSYKAILTFSHYLEGIESQFLLILSPEDYAAWKEENIDQTITDVRYDWLNGKAYITIKHENRTYEFDCNSTWTEQDCMNAIASLNL